MTTGQKFKNWCQTKQLINHGLIWLVVAILGLGMLVFNWPQLSQPTDVADAAARFANSQYVVGELTEQKVDDETVYITAADDYLSGKDPTGINFEHPPLAKYLMGFSLRLTGNVLWTNVVFYLLMIAALAYALKWLKVDRRLIVVAMVLLGWNYTVLLYAGQALLETVYASSAMIFLAALFYPREKWGKYIVLGLSLGLFLGTKYYFPLMFLLIIPLFYWAWRKKTSLVKPLASLGLALVVYLSGYTVFFLQGNSLIDWVKFEWFSFKWRIGDRSMPKFLILQTLFTGRHHAWWLGADQWATDQSWMPLLPVYAVSSLVAGGWNLIKNWRSLPDQILFFFNVGLLAACALGGAYNVRILFVGFGVWLLAIAKWASELIWPNGLVKAK